jgi:hypothetical protein
LLRFHGDAASSAVEDAAVNYQSPSIIAAGADAHGVSLLMMLMNLCLGLVCFKAPKLIGKAGLAKRGAIIFAFLNLITWVPLAFIFLFTRFGVTPALITLLWFINVVPGMLLSFQKDNWLSNIVPHNTMGGYLGQRLAIKSALYLGAFFLLGYLLDRLGKENIAGFTVIFTIALGAVLINFIIFTFMNDTKNGTVPLPKIEKVSFSLPEYFRELKEKKLDLFILFTTFFHLTVGFSGPLYAIYMLNDLHFSYMSYTLIISAEFLARVISAPMWGRFADKEGSIRLLGIVARIIPLMPVCWLFCHNLGYLIVVQLISGACWGAFDLSTQSYLYKVAPKPKKLYYIVYTRCLILLFTAAGGLLGAFCINDIFTTFGSKILSIFWISGVARIIVVIYLMPKLVDLAMSFSRPSSPPDVNLETLQQVLTSKRGQFYRREQQVADAASRIQKITEMMAADMKEYGGNRQWADPVKFGPPPPDIIPVEKPVNSSLRLAHYREAMAAQSFTQPAVVHHEVKLNAERLKLRYDLERQLKVLTSHAEESMAYHGIEENEDRLIQRFHLNVAAVPVEKTVAHHEIEQNIDRLKLRYHINLQPSGAAAFSEHMTAGLPARTPKEFEQAKSFAGLYRDKVSWAKYMKQSIDEVLKEKGQPVPVTVNMYNRNNVSERMTNRNQIPKINIRRSPVLV